MLRRFNIKPNFDCPQGLNNSFAYYIKGIEQSVNDLIFKSCEKEKFNKPEDILKRLTFNLPIIDWQLSNQTGILSLTCLAPAQNTHGLGRFICDHSSRWLLPGKQLALVHVNSLAFSLEKESSYQLFFHQQLIRIENTQDLQLIIPNLGLFTKQLKMNILTVMHARNIVMQKSLSIEEKKMIIQENIATLLGKGQREIDRNAYDHTHQFIMKMISEENAVQFKESLNSLIELKPQIFDRGVFNELQDQISGFSDEFIACRDTKHLTRMISYEYLFRKNTIHMALKQPNKRHLSIKLLQTQIKNSNSNHPILSILVAMNMLRENEVFKEKNLFKAIQACLPNVLKINGSFIEHKSEKTIKTFYIEIEKKEKSLFNSEELKIIKKRLPSEIKLRVESVYNPVFMQKNEEEVLKNILILSNELKYVSDIPQLYVSFQKQTENKLWFTVILLRLIKSKGQDSKDLLKNVINTVKIENLECKIVGHLRKKYAKEAIICDFCIEKKLFIRKDFSLDLYEARRVLVSTLEKEFGEIRDYNGGIISKQKEALVKLRTLLNQINIHNDFLVENYFYSLYPSYMPSILPEIILKKHFQLVLKALEISYSFSTVFFEVQYINTHQIILLATSHPSFRDYITGEINQLNITSSNITSLNMTTEEIFLVGYIHKFETQEEAFLLIDRLTQSVKKWNTTIEREEFQLEEDQEINEEILIIS